jgi:hypothetical protein
MESRWNYTDRRKVKNSDKSSPSATFSNTNPTLADPVANPDLIGERPVTNPPEPSRKSPETGR